MKLIILRGLPGTGKSTYAKKHFPKFKKLEADDWHMRNGQYQFDPKELANAHAFCLLRTEYYLRKGKSVVVSNTFTQFWEMAPYFELSKKYNAKCQVIEMKKQYGNLHNVPASTLQDMKNRWQDYGIISS